MSTSTQKSYLEVEFDKKEKAIADFDELLQRIRTIVGRDSIELFINVAKISFDTTDPDEFYYYSQSFIDYLHPHLRQLEDNFSKISQIREETPFFDLYIILLGYVLEYALNQYNDEAPPARLVALLMTVNGYFNEMRDTMLKALGMYINACSEFKHKLHEKRKQLLCADSYGFIDDKDWISEKIYFSTTFMNQIGADTNDIVGYVFVKILANHVIDEMLDEMDNTGTFLESDDAPLLAHEKGPQYEAECISIFSDNGWVALDTPRSGDKGADIIASKRGLRIVAQCKNWTQKVGTSAVQEIAAAKAFYEADFAILINESAVTPQAQEIANKLGIITASKKDIPEIEIMIIKRQLSQL